MPGPVSSFFLAHHAEARGLLDQALRGPGEVDAELFDVFRHRLLRMVSMEEKLLFPALASALGADPPFRRALHSDHARFAALCVPTPEREWLENLRDLLEVHVRLETADDGLYATCDRVLKDELPTLLPALERFPPLHLAPFNSGPEVRALVARVLEATGIHHVPH